MMILISSEKMKEHFEAYGEILEVVRGNYYCMKGYGQCWACALLSLQIFGLLPSLLPV